MKIIYFDIDGTLRDENTGISGKTRYGFCECKRQGIRTVICTGRNQVSIQEDVLDLKPDGIISGGGCFISYDQAIFRAAAFSSEQVVRFLGEGENCKLGISMETKENVYMNTYAAYIHRRMFLEKTKGLSDKERKRIRDQNHFLYQDNLQEIQPGREKIHKVCLNNASEAWKTHLKWFSLSRSMTIGCWNVSQRGVEKEVR